MNYAGDISPQEAWDILRDNPDAVLVDVRTEAEWRFVGVPDTTSVQRPTKLVEWVDFSGAANTSFLQQLGAALDDRPAEAPVIFLCRSGQRSAHAADVATGAGIGPSYNVLDGFEGHLDDSGHRGGTGWRACGLPWRQS